MYGNKRELIKAMWRERVIAANNSELTKTEWCQQNHISIKTYYKWQKLIQEEEIERINVNEKSEKDLMFVELPITREDHATVSADAQNTSLKFKPEIAINIGAQTVYIAKDVTEKTLATVIKVLTHA